ncbi:hypothetical protein HYH02_005815 [Chlamydomonas schloesseri]|uniref:Uncharacterized protein n=1 Tax=Chlamydomonas schloesseri TaxID=2026947 RepID=A0A835WKG1_9CHLO|nr:hypothetical protein HYH02_005815 [Chlamydomonas schloesseri]|eukprot:KAG2449066.1 hypothetical protein HYH02_005815 [Chlamydomonas schloesseri]
MALQSRRGLLLVLLLASAWMGQLACAQRPDLVDKDPRPHDGPHGGPHGPHDGPHDGPHGGPHHHPDGDLDGPGPHPPPPHPWLPPWLAHLICPPPPPPPFDLPLPADGISLGDLPRPGFETATGPFEAAALAADAAAADGDDRPPRPHPPPPHPPLPLPAWMVDMLCGPPPPRPGGGRPGMDQPAAGLEGTHPGGPGDHDDDGADERPPPSWFLGFMDWINGGGAGGPQHPGDGGRPCPRSRAFAAGARSGAAAAAATVRGGDGEGLAANAFDIQHPDDEMEMEAAIAAALEAEMAKQQQQQQGLKGGEEVTGSEQQSQVLRLAGGSGDPHAGRAGRGAIGGNSRHRALRAGRL